MNLELITIGTELLLGFTVDSNSAYAGRALSQIGVTVVRRTTVPDDHQAIGDAVSTALARTGAVLISGGLGPTKDDITKKAVAEVFGAPLEFREDVWQSLLERYRMMRRPEIAERNRVQAEVPRGATVIPNAWGSAPALWLEGEPGLAIMLPGVPFELEKLIANEIVPRLQQRTGAEEYGGRATLSLTLRTAGIAESDLAQRLGDIDDELAPVTLAYLPGVAGVDIRLTAWNSGAAAATALLEQASARLQPLLGDHFFGCDDTTLAAELLALAHREGLTLATAESCTGGMVGQMLTDVPGSSAVYLGGVVAYSNEVKSRQLGVPADLIERHGAVSEEVALAMARGARDRLGADLAVAITGVAGPGGGTADKPVGTVWTAWTGTDGLVARRWAYPGGREAIRRRAATAALFQLYRTLKRRPGSGG